MRTLHKTLLATIAAAVVVVPFLDLDADASAPEKPDSPPAVVSVADAVRTELAPRHWAPGSVISRQDARVASEQGGRVIRAAEVGQQVQAGQALAVLDDTALRLREQEAQADLARIQAQLELATRQEQRYAQLAAQQNIARAQYEQLRADRDMLVQDRARAQALLAQTRHQRTQMTVRAPFAGVVAEREVELGEYLTTGDGEHYREWGASVCVGEPDFRRICAQRRDAVVEVCGEPFSDPGGEYSVGREVVGVSHGISGVLAGGFGEAAAAGELERFCF